MATTEFDEIRPYNDEELPQIFEELIADPAFQKAATEDTRLQKQTGFSGNILLWYFVENSCGPYGWADSGSYGFTG